MNPTTDPIKVYISCSTARKDKTLVKKLEAQLATLRNRNLITVWSRENLTGGTTTETDSMRELEAAQIVLCMISAEFLASTVC